MNDDSVGLVMDCLKKEKVQKHKAYAEYIVYSCLLLFIFVYLCLFFNRSLFINMYKIPVQNNKNKQEQTKMNNIRVLMEKIILYNLSLHV